MPFHRRIRIAIKQKTRRGAQFRNRGSVRGVAGVVEQRYGAILLRKQQWKGKKCTHLCALQAKPLMLNQDFLQGEI
jgi:hypothetical protein